MSESDQKQTEAGCRVVAIGASAGGLEALSAFFRAIDSDTGLAYVVIQHLSPDHPSLMPEILAKYTNMPVHQAEEGQVVEANCVYLIPPRKELAIEQGRLHLKARSLSRGVYLPIDTFFQSLAREQKQQAIGVVLSGSGSDGSRGAMAIKEAGGMVMIQDPDSAEFESMPRSVFATKSSDFVLKPEQMPDMLLDFVHHRPRMDIPVPLEEMTDEQHYQQIVSLVKEQSMLDLGEYKRNTIFRRIAHRMNINRLVDLIEYIHLLQDHHEEVAALSREVLIGVTSFFRDKEAFDRLRTRVVQPLVEAMDPNEQLRIWDVGCATGEEAYSLAILLDEALSRYDDGRSAKIFATDVDPEAIDFAARGIYPESIVNEVTPEHLRKYFTRLPAGKYQVKPAVRRMIVFAKHNAMAEPPFTHLQLICCRNMLIYFQPQAQRRLTRIFEFALEHGGYLFLGPSETLTGLEGSMTTLDTRWKIHQLTSEQRVGLDISTSMAMHKSDSLRRVSAHRISPTQNKQIDSSISEAMCNALAIDFVPSAVAVDEEMDIVHVFGDVSKYCTLRAGSPRLSLSVMLPETLYGTVSAGIHRCQDAKKDVVLKGIRFADTEGRQQRVDLRFRHVWDPRARSAYTLVFFENPDRTSDNSHFSQMDLDEATRKRIVELEDDLRFARQDLQATLEEMETSNEELQATNEELVVSNEELQSTNEELQSVNEELHTVNAEYQEKIAELTQLNDDMDNLLRTSEVGTMFLDEHLQIRKFTPAITSCFHVLQQDLGRPFSHISHSLEYPDLLDDVTCSMRQVRRIEKRVETSEAKTVLLRIDPYLPGDESAEKGAVITAIDISELSRLEEARRQAEQRFRNTFEMAAVGIAYVSGETGRFLRVNPKLCQILGYSEEELIGKGFQEVTHPRDAEKGKQLFEQLRSGQQSSAVMEKRYLHKDGNEVYCRIHTRYIAEENHCLTVLEDITEQKQQDWMMRHLAAVVRSSEDAILSKDLNGRILSWNRGAEELYGYSRQEVLGQNIKILFPPNLIEQSDEILQSIADGKSLHFPQAIRLAKDGSKLEVSLRITPIFDDEGNVYGASTIARDIRQISALEHRFDRQSAVTEAIIESAQDPICEVDAKGRFRRFNQGCERLTGFRAENVVGQYFWDVVLPGDKRTEVVDYFQRIVDSDENGDRFEGDWVTSSGQRVRIRWQFLIHRDTAGMAKYLLCVGQAVPEDDPQADPD
ncbi:MAG: PAS domain S-box protein [Phycisphaerae bacterium]